ncbi:M81 family metallopeptidase [Methylobacterium oryzae CBMB20]
MKIFIAGLATETNTLAPLPTGRSAFLADYARAGTASRNPAEPQQYRPQGLARAGRGGRAHRRREPVHLRAARRIALRGVYEELRDALLEDLEAAMPVDAVLLFMHGAMVAEGYDDCEGDTLERVRAIVGPDATIGVELDLHCHLTETMRASADVIVIYKEYPHTDIVDRARDLYPLVVRTVAKDIRPVMAYADCRIVNMWRTSREPVAGFVRRMEALEGRDGILSVSFGHGFPWGDVADVGAKMLVVADGDAGKAQALANELAGAVWAMRRRRRAAATRSTRPLTGRSPPATRARWCSRISPTMPARARPPTTPRSSPASPSGASRTWRSA